MNNVINKFFLWIVLLPSVIYGRMGVNVLHLKAILRTKLIMDDRRPNTLQQTKRNKNKAVNLATLGTMFVSALLGCMFLFAFMVGKDYTVHLTFYFLMFIFLLASTLISDFTSVLIDVRDNYIILPKPVNDKTIVVSRLLHIIIHISKMVLPMTIPGIIFMGINVGWYGTILFVVLVLLSTLLTIFLINALYIIILKITTPQKFQSIISSFQIVFAIMMYAGYQVVPRLMGRTEMQNLELTKASKWIWLAPPYWFAKAWQSVMEVSFTVGGISSIALSLIAPLASIYIVIKYFAPSFNQKLSLINSGSAETLEPVSVQSKKAGSDTAFFITAIANSVCRAGAERMSFLFTWKMTSRSKDFKLKVYPSIGYLLVMMGLMIYQFSSKFSFQVHGERLPFLFIGVIYLSSFVLITAISQIIYSEKYKAAWFYYSTPVSTPGLLINGAFKAITMKFYLPVALVIFPAALIILGVSILPNLLLALFNELFICSLTTYLIINELPFSSPQGNNVKTGNFIKNLMSLLIPVMVAGFHFLIYKINVVVYIFAAMAMLLTWLIQDGIRKKTWARIKGEISD